MQSCKKAKNVWKITFLWKSKRSCEFFLFLLELHISRVLNFPPGNGKNDPFPAGKKPGNREKCISKARFPNFGHVNIRVFKLTLINAILPHRLYNKLQKIHITLSSQIGQILVIFCPFWANFGKNREISRENAHFPPGNFPVAISRFPVSRREMCNSNSVSSNTRNITFHSKVQHLKSWYGM